LLDIAEDQYDDYNPDAFSDIALNDRVILSIINNDTNWNIDESTFYQFFVKLSK